MFIFTVKVKNAKRVKFVVALCIAVALIALVCVVGVVNHVPDTAYSQSMGEYSTVIDNNTKVEGFISGINLSAGELYSVKQVYIPATFNDTYMSYNELQKRQGLDLERYKGKRCTLYVYELTDYTIDNSDAYISVVVYKDRVIGGHISTLTQDATMYTFFGE